MSNKRRKVEMEVDRVYYKDRLLYCRQKKKTNRKDKGDRENE